MRRLTIKTWAIPNDVIPKQCDVDGCGANAPFTIQTKADSRSTHLFTCWFHLPQTRQRGIAIAIDDCERRYPTESFAFTIVKKS